MRSESIQTAVIVRTRASGRNVIHCIHLMGVDFGSDFVSVFAPDISKLLLDTNAITDSALVRASGSLGCYGSAPALTSVVGGLTCGFAKAVDSCHLLTSSSSANR